ncbi:MAG: DinB family protein [Candidatus Hodarchaeales archaeon]|jgi:uncharacterized damage-inducible protein DinB
MARLLNVKSQVSYTVDYVMKNLDKAILKIPPDKLSFSPADNTKTAADLALHIYQGALLLAVGTEKGEFKEEDFEIIPFDASTVKSAEEIVEYGKKVKDLIRKILNNLTDEDMNKEIKYDFSEATGLAEGWGTWTVKGSLAMLMIVTEVNHHRGQLCLYLRLMGIQPPFIYDFS